jgi:hypothetical protein
MSWVALSKPAPMILSRGFFGMAVVKLALKILALT